MKPETKSLALEKAAPMQVAGPVDSSLTAVNMNALLAKAVEQGSAMEVIKELRLMESEIQKRRAKAAFDESMAAFQAECPVIKKTKDGAKQAYKYAPLDDILAQTRGLIQAHGFSFSMTSEIDAGWVKAICKVTHRLGHSEISEFKVPIDSRNPMMNDPQRYGGSMTFAKRYAFCNIFGILTADEDRDGETNRRRQTGAGSLGGSVDDRVNKRKLVDLTRDISAVEGYALTEEDKKIINQYLWDESFIAPDENLSTLEGKRLSEVVSKLESRK